MPLSADFQYRATGDGTSQRDRARDPAKGTFVHLVANLLPENPLSGSVSVEWVETPHRMSENRFTQVEFSPVQAVFASGVAGVHLGDVIAIALAHAITEIPGVVFVASGQKFR